MRDSMVLPPTVANDLKKEASLMSLCIERVAAPDQSEALC
jgi:hypothetical protein